MTDWHESDEFWSAFGGGMFDDAAWEAAASQVEDIVALLGATPGARVLDLCCGPGRHSLALADLGYRVLGVDRTEAFLEEARRRADEAGLDVDLAHADMREFVEPGAFDFAINVNTSFGYFRDAADDRRVLSHVLESLKPGGRALLELAGKEVIARIFQARDWTESSGEFLLYERHIEDDWSWIRNRWIRVELDERQEFEVEHRLYAASELKGLFTEVGFRDVSAYGGLDGSPYDQAAKRLVVVGSRP